MRSNGAADQRICFHDIDGGIPLLPKSKISSLNVFSVVLQPGLCLTWPETPITGFLMTWLNYNDLVFEPSEDLHQAEHHRYHTVFLPSDVFRRILSQLRKNKKNRR